MLLCLAPYAITGYVNDDARNSLFWGDVIRSGRTPWQLMMYYQQGWADSGRLFPLSVWLGVYAWMYPFRHIVLYRALHLATTVACLALFGRLVRKIDARLSPLWPTLAVVLCFQMRPYHDPVMSYGPLLQMSVLFALGSLLAALAERRTARAVLYGLGLLNYEVGYLVYPALLWFEALRASGAGWARFRSALRATRVEGLVTLACLAVSFWMRANATAQYPGTHVGTVAGALVTAYRQAVASLPLSYVTYFPSSLSLYELTPYVLPLTLVVAALTFIAAKRTESIALPRDTRRLLWGWGLILWIGPALLIGLSSKYQRELEGGIGYLPVFVSAFGIGLLSLALTRFGPRLALPAAVVAALTWTANANLAVRNLVAERNPRESAARSLHEGLGESWTAQTTLLVRSNKVWFDESFFAIEMPRFVPGLKVERFTSPEALQSRAAELKKSGRLPVELTLDLDAQGRGSLRALGL